MPHNLLKDEYGVIRAFLRCILLVFNFVEYLILQFPINALYIGSNICFIFFFFSFLYKKKGGSVK